MAGICNVKEAFGLGNIKQAVGATFGVGDERGSCACHDALFCTNSVVSRTLTFWESNHGLHAFGVDVLKESNIALKSCRSVLLLLPLTLLPMS